MARSEISESANEESVVNQGLNEDEFLDWKQNAPALYDVLLIHTLETTSMTCQLAPWKSNLENPNSQIAILGTSFQESEQNQLLIANLELPEEGNEESAVKSGNQLLNIKQRVAHQGEILKARGIPDCPGLITTKANDGALYVFQVDIEKEYSNSEFQPLGQLEGHSTSGFGLDIIKNTATKIISSDDEGVICLWQLDQPIHSKMPGTYTRLPPLIRTIETGVAINDVKFNHIKQDIFAGASDDGLLTFYDSRKGPTPFIRHISHTCEVYSLDFSPNDEFLLISGDSNGAIKLWDMRKLTNEVHLFEGHHKKVLRVEWSPKLETVFASCSEDNLVVLWDCAKIGDDLQRGEQVEGGSELLFNHKGHRDKVQDISWSSTKPLGLLSVDSESIVQYWEIDSDIYYED